MATALKNRALLDLQGRRLNIAGDFGGAPEFDELAGDNITLDRAVNLRDGDFYVGVDLTARGDDERAVFGTNMSRELAVNA